jgi:hypothetical protein
MRKKLWEFQGVKYTIGAFTFKQVQKLFGGGPASFIDIVVTALQNGEPSRDPAWTEDAIKEEFDPIAFFQLKDDIIIFNDIKLVPQGEDGAADSTSSKSAAA